MHNMKKIHFANGDTLAVFLWTIMLLTDKAFRLYLHVLQVDRYYNANVFLMLSYACHDVQQRRNSSISKNVYLRVGAKWR